MNRPPFAPRTGGTALLLCMLVLAALTILGLAAVSDAGLQERMAGNLDQARKALHSADLALDWGEGWLLGLDGERRPETCAETCGGGEAIRGPGGYPATPEHQSDAWWAEHGFPAGSDPGTGDFLDSALGTLGGHWIIEEIHFEDASETGAERPATGYYRIIARGSGPRGASVAVAETIVARPWGDAAWSDPFPGGPAGTPFCRRPGMDSPCGRFAWRQRR